MESTISILTRFFENWTVTREVVSITDIVGATATIKVFDPLWVTPCLDIQLDGLKYNVKSVNKVNECEYDFMAVDCEQLSVAGKIRMLLNDDVLALYYALFPPYS